MGRFINPFSDWGFKRIFGQEFSKDLLIAFLNDLFEGEHVITELTFLDKEQLAETKDMSGVIYDIYCQTQAGERIIVEMQNRMQRFYTNRTLYYAAKSIVGQAHREKENWNYELAPVYVISFMNFALRNKGANKLRTDVMLMDKDTGEPFSNELRLVYLALPFFKKEAEECETNFDRWIYVLKNMNMLERMPFAAQYAAFAKLAEVTDYSALNQKDRDRYDESLRVLRDYYATYETAIEDGREQGLAEGRAEGRELGLAMAYSEVARKMLKAGATMEYIKEMTGLSEDEVRRLAD